MQVQQKIHATRATVGRKAVVVRAHAEGPAASFGKVAAATLLAGAASLSAVDAARADIAGLTPCSESAAYAKRLKNEVKGLTKRLKNYEADSAPALAIKATIERTEKRFANYAKSGLLCGNDGLPHLISDPGLALRFGHAGEVFIPTIGFLYVAGWIGYVGRQYLIASKAESKPTEKEIIIDVPAALKLSVEGFGWPLAVVNELKAGTLTETADNITVSPR
ncbi:Photosystem I reaction center subunit III [Monoraphidium neglectum]|uniref:Photosystem I reaction center subunit III n=1 Tax=Monoraphidium neglectum TaxID=145388 RepID=A0A0D2M3B3_9CHLO|nr:Photosystem I reaction center subunit III [Monoraphidium neglectum]KIY98069.1 Photosystem I reaction center subunit III [Monoraphidium neglectum]|eukprot:XP_013897089.1 Photosystem I reaction center subunit III [Monoraphidium neglectum]